MTYRFLPHTADIRAGIEAPSFPALLEDLVALLRELTAGGEAVVEPRDERPLAVTGADPADLLLHFARELLVAFQLDAIVPARFVLEELRLPPAGAPALRGRVLGEPFDPSRHETQPELKAVTRHGLSVARDADGWHAEIVIDV